MINHVKYMQSVNSLLRSMAPASDGISRLFIQFRNSSIL